MTNAPDDFSDKEIIKKIRDSIEQPDKFAEIFCVAAKKQKSIDEILKINIIKVVEQDIEVREYLRSTIRDLEKEDWRFFVKKFGFALWGLLTFVLGSFLTAFISHLVK